MTAEEKQFIVHKAFNSMLSVVAAALGEAPVGAVLAVQFTNPEDCFGSYATAKMEGEPTKGLPLLPAPVALKIMDNLGAKMTAEIRAAKVRINTVKA